MRKLFLLLFLLTSTLYAQIGEEIDILDHAVVSEVNKAMPNSQLQLAIILDIHSDLHINAHKTSEDFLIPTVVDIAPQPYYTVKGISYPEAVMRTLFAQQKLAVYEDEVVIYVTLELTDALPADSLIITGALSYQGCNDQTCFQPQEDALRFAVPITRDASKVESIHSNLFDSDRDKQSGDTFFGQTLTDDELRAKEIVDKGFYALFFFFLIGLGLNLTPCVYPVIPLTVSYFGGQQTKTRGSSFINALFYLFGIAISFSALGLISGLAGKQWGFLFASPWFVVVIALIILSMAASMFGAFEIRVPSWLLTKTGASRQGVVGALLMGLTVGVVIAPCAAGIIIGLVGLVAKLGLVIKGALLFFVMGLGLGLPYLILGTFSGLLNKMPQSGVWLVWIRKIFGLLLIGVAIYFLLPQLLSAEDKLGFQLGFLTLFGGLYLGFLDQESGYTRSFKRIKAIFGLVLIVLGVLWVQHSFIKQEARIDWSYYSGEDVNEFKDPDKPTFIDFYADWCAPCKQLDRNTFQDEDVVKLSLSFNMIKVDCTKPDKATKSLMAAFNVEGLPTLVFLDEDGLEHKNLRQVGYVAPEKFVNYMQTVLQD